MATSPEPTTPPDIFLFIKGFKNHQSDHCGSAFILKNGSEIQEYGKHSAGDSSIRTAVEAILTALRRVPESTTIKIVTDSEYLRDAWKWAHSWVKRDWVTSQGTPVLHQVIWKEIFEIVTVKGLNISSIFVPSNIYYPPMKRVSEIASSIANWESCSIVEKADLASYPLAFPTIPIVNRSTRKQKRKKKRVCRQRSNHFR